MDAWYEEFDGLLTRAQENDLQRAKYLVPICAENFSTEEWYQIYKDTEQYEEIFGVERVAWTDG